MILKSVSRLGIAAFALLTAADADEPLLEFHKGDHVAIVGSGLADRQQHQGWFEALIQKEFAGQDLTIRNLGFTADEINLHPRSDDVPPTSWFLSMKKSDSTLGDPKIIYKAGTDFGADVILAYWGFNESFQGPQGLDAFKKNLGEYLDGLKSAKFNGESAPRIVLFSPIAQEDMHNPNFPDGKANNVNIGLYTRAMAEVAKVKSIPFVDLYEPSSELYQKTGHPLTINGVHLNDEGDRMLAPIQFEAVFGKKSVPTEDPSIAKIRAAVLEKNYEWSHRYRTVDQFNIFGQRSRIDYEGVNNAKILGQELAQRDVKTANRDKLVWAVAQGKPPYQVIDDNLPPVDLTPPNVATEIPYSDPEETIKHLKLPAGCKVELVASEKTFPDLINPVQMNFDTKGRLWLAVWPNYPETTPTTKVFDKILIVDLDPETGKAVKTTTFIDGLNCPTGFQFYKDGILLMQSPDLLWVRDTDGDGKADKTERVLHGLDAADSHHETNSMCYEPGGAVYLSDGVFLRSNVETAEGPVRNKDGAIYRYEPVTGRFMRHVPYNFMNPHGRVFDYWGNDLITDATGNENFFGPAMSGHLDTGAHPEMEQFWDRPSRPCPGTAILSSRHFPDDWQGLFLNTNVIGIQGIFRAKISEEGSGLTGKTLENLITADIAQVPNFRPSGISVAPDGSLYFMDWSQMLIGHLQHHLRDPNRDHRHGRLYRITYEGRPLLVPKKIDGEPIASLLELLKEPENDVRLRAKIELGKHDSKEVTDAVMQWVKTLDPKEAKHEHNLLEALWVHQWHNVVNPGLLDRVLKSPEFRARAQAVRVIGYWRDRVPGALAKVKAAADDEAPRVRLEAVRVASFFRETAAADAALAILKHPQDYYLDYCFKETMRQLGPWWKTAVAEGREIATGNAAGIAFLFDAVSDADLAKLPKSEATLTAILTRPGIDPPQRAVALTELAKIRNSSPAETIVSILDSHSEKGRTDTRDLCAMLLQQPPADLNASRASILKLTETGPPASVQQAAIAAIITADGSIDAAWKNAADSPRNLATFLNALPLVPDATVRGSAFDVVKSLLTKLPDGISGNTTSHTGTQGRFVRIALPREGTLSLAEVQLFSGERNIAGNGQATQQSTAYQAPAELAIDGKTNGQFEGSSVTHTNENTSNPWWELDLGSELAIDSVVIWNRTDEGLGNRLEGFDLTILDSGRHEIFRKSGNPAPQESVKIDINSDVAGTIRRAAIGAFAGLGRDPQAVFTELATLIKNNDQVATAAQAISRLPNNTWSAEQAAIAAKGIVDWARTVPADNRTAKEYTDTILVASKLIAMLPPEQAAAANKALGDLDVKVFTIKTVREQLRYDIARLVVEAGKPFQILFQNDDAMPHNLVFVMPGTMQDVAIAVQTLAPDKLDSKGRAYVIEGDSRIIDATKLIEAGKSETLHLTAPSAEGIYQYVCTFPGHWAIMKGELIVTKDVKAYLAAHPEK